MATTDTVPCGTCGNPVHPDAGVCPHCRSLRNPVRTPAPAPAKAVRRKRPPIYWCALLAVAGVAWVLISGWINPPSALDKDTLGKSACTSFVALAQDSTAGIVSDDEYRDRIKDIYKDGRFADSRAIRTASTHLLAEATSGADGSAVAEMTTACKNLAND